MEVVGAVASFIAIAQAVAAVPKIVGVMRGIVDAGKDLSDLADELERLHDYHQLASMTIGLFGTTDGDLTPVLHVTEPAYLKRLRLEMEDFTSQLQERFQECALERIDSGKMRVARRKWFFGKKDLTRLRDRCRQILRDLEGALTSYALLVQHSHISITQDVKSQIRNLTVRVNDIAAADQEETTSLDSATTMAPPYLESPTKKLGRPQVDIWGACRCKCHTRRLVNQGPTYTLSLPGSFAIIFRQVCLDPAAACPDCQCISKSSKSELQLRYPPGVGKGSLRALLPLLQSTPLLVSLRPKVFVAPTHDIWTTLGRNDMMGLFKTMSKYGYAITDQNLSNMSIVEYATWKYPELFVSKIRMFTDLVKLSNDVDAKRITAWRCRLMLENGELPADDSEVYSVKRFMNACDDEIEDDALHWRVYEAIRNMDDLTGFIDQSKEELVKFARPDGETFLHEACRRRNVVAAKTLLLFGADMHAKDQRGDTPMHVCMANCAIDCAKLLLDLGCDIHAPGAKGMTPLHHAVTNPDIRIDDFIRMLLEKGASATKADSLGQTSLHHIAWAKMSTVDQAEERLSILFKHNANGVIEARDKLERPALLWAIYQHNAILVRAFLKTGVPTNTLGSHDQNILHAAALHGTREMMEILIHAGITGIDIRTRDKLARTPLESMRWREKNVQNEHSDRDSFRPSQDIIEAFERLLRDVRDRSISDEVERLEDIIRLIQNGKFVSAKEDLGVLAGQKEEAQMILEADTIRAVCLQLDNQMYQPAVESIKEFLEASVSRLRISPFDEDNNGLEYHSIWHAIRLEGESPEKAGSKLRDSVDIETLRITQMDLEDSLDDEDSTTSKCVKE